MKLLWKSMLAVGVYLASAQVYGGDLGIGQSFSTSSESRRIKVGFSGSTAHKLGLLYRTTQSKDAVSDPFSSSFKVGYRFKDVSQSVYSIDLKLSDDSYFYRTFGALLKTGLNLTSSTRLNLGLEGAQRTYSLNQRETFSHRTGSIGIDQVAFESLSFGLELSVSQYQGEGPQTTKALQGAVVAEDDVQSYIDSMFGQSVSIFFEYAMGDVSLGLTQTADTYKLSGQRTNTTEIYADVDVASDWSIGIFYARGLSEGSTTPSNSSGFNLGYRF